MSNNKLEEINLDEIISIFKNEGFVVMPIFSSKQVKAMRRDFHLSLGIDHQLALAGNPDTLSHLSGARMKSCAKNIYAPRWKLNAVTDDRILRVAEALIKTTFGPGNIEGFTHPLGKGDDIRLFLDRTHYRLPDHVRNEGGLGLHLDRNPYDPYFLNTKNFKLIKFRPIQSFISLVDQFNCESGGLRVVRAFHKEIDEYFERSSQDLNSNDGGEFFRLDYKKHAQLWKRLEPVDVPAGSIVFWDNRLPHSTAEKLTSSDSREVLFTSYLPSNEINCNYAKLQLEYIKQNLVPPAFNKGSKDYIYYDLDLDLLSERQREILGFND